MDDEITILIVDDEQSGRDALEGVLFSQGYQLVQAQNGQEAYEKALEYMPDVILLDVMMPNMDGFEVCRLLRSDPILAEVPIILVTALDDRSSRINGIESGADDFISKPFDRIELRARVKTITRLNRYRRLVLERARFVWVVEQSKEGYVILDTNDQILYSNPAAQVFLNLPAGEAKTETFLEWVQNQYRCEPEETWKHWPVVAEVQTPLYLLRPETPFSRPAWLYVEVLDLPMGKTKNILLRITEISERLALHHEIWSFHNMISHKLRTPLSNITMAATIFNHRAMNNDMGGSLEISEAIISNVKRLESEIQDIFRYLNTPFITQTGNHFHLSNLQSVFAQLCEELGIDHARLSINCRLEKEVTLKLTNRSLEIILRELLQNSKKFHPQLNPEIEVIVNALPSGDILLSVIDDGLHLSPDQLSQAWISYYQAETQFTGEVNGMGLGLPTIATILWEAGGHCRMLNRSDQSGIIVELTIPVVENII